MNADMKMIHELILISEKEKDNSIEKSDIDRNTHVRDKRQKGKKGKEKRR